MSDAPWITWLFVITIPSSLIIKPYPNALVCLCWGEPNISSNGEPGGNSNGKGFDLVVTVVVVEIFTTDGINLSAKSANDDGISWALEIEK